MKKLVLLIFGCSFFTVIFAQSGAAFKGNSLQNAAYSVYVIDADNGIVLYNTPQVSLVPASVMKIVTTAAALEILGADFEFHTQLGITGKVNAETGLLEGNLVLRGGCDPAFYSEYFPEHYKGTFEAWVAALSNAGIKSIRGNFIVDLSQMNGTSVPGGWLWEDIGNYYGAGVSALTYSDNFYKIHFSSDAEPDKPVTISRTEPAIDSLNLANNVTSSSVNRDLAFVYGAPGSFSQLVEGSIPKGRSDFIVKAAMPNPAHIAVAEFVKILKYNGIDIQGSILYVNASQSKEITLIADKRSPALRDLIIPLNKESINLFAEHLLHEIGRARKGSSSLDSSIIALKEFWIEKGIFLKGFYPTDGSGLSRSNGICPRTLAEILRYMYLSSNRDDFFNSLPVAGRDGTLQLAFKGTKLENNLHAKTGSMTRVKSMTGIFTNKDGKKLIFAIITNNFEGTQTTVSRSIEDFLGEVYVSDTVPVKKSNH
ncbi:MAG: D-alanyl-D-alanine carboxypeptidase/D-alanyl-D-alanine-endopeptidase [Bacteroidia bacterium]|nr:D-alanyl-D-alanine carboxypeptidase/D-alanyl-D-alanine-endopeptidase [Bacteroidia bacterium]